MIAMMCETAGNDLMAPGFRIPFVHVQRSRTIFPNDPNDCFFFSFLVAPAEDDDHYEELAAVEEESSGVWIDSLPVPVPTCLFFEDEEEPALSEMDDDILISIRELFESDSVEDNLDFRCDEIDDNERDENMSRGLLRSDWSDSWTYWHPVQDHTWVHQCSNHPPIKPNQRNMDVHDVPKLGRSRRFFKSTRKFVARVGRGIMKCFCLPCRR
jgi:hypothetical protein